MTTSYFSLLGAVAFAVVGGMIAQSKNRNGIAWGFLCLLLPLVGLLLILMVNDRNHPASSPELQEDADSIRSAGYEDTLPPGSW